MYKRRVITARLGIDLIESEHELYVGRPGNYGERSANFGIQNADVILCVGCRLSSSLVGHNPKMFGQNAQILVVDIDQKELDKPGVKIDYKIKGDCKEFFAMMLQNLEEYSLPQYDKWIQICNNWKRKYPVVQPEYKEEKPVNSYYFTDNLSNDTPSDAAGWVDTGAGNQAETQ
ncbi:hypothetical protein CG709_11200, partial [Lachnotalea glycerini]